MKRYDSLDLMKAIAILMVISLHVPLWHIDFIEGHTAARIMQYAGRLLSEGVPIFVTINGFLMLKKQTFDLHKHLKKCLRLFLILFFWILVYIVLGISLHGEWSTTTVSDFIYYIFATGSDGGSVYTGGLWFLEWLLGVYLLFPIIWNAYKNNFQIFKYFFWVLFATVIGLNTLRLIGNVIYIYNDAPSYFEMISMISRITFIKEHYVLFFCFGGMVYYYYDKIIQYRKWFILSGIISWVVATGYGVFVSLKNGSVYDQTFNYSTIFNLITMLGWFALTSNFKVKEKRCSALMAFMGKNTFVFYIYHLIIVHTISAIHPEYLVNHRFIIYIGIVILCCILTMIINKVPVWKKLTSL